uniref:Uncharacterized protein n=1 Tax=Caenorhabditis tropicalis TaxID=1561998 RepID=A0A1I7TIE7_9PELO
MTLVGNNRFVKKRKESWSTLLKTEQIRNSPVLCVAPFTYTVPSTRVCVLRSEQFLNPYITYKIGAEYSKKD